MIQEIQVVRTANRLMRALDDEAVYEILMQANGCLASGDLTGRDFWCRVQDVVEETQGHGHA